MTAAYDAPNRVQIGQLIADRLLASEAECERLRASSPHLVALTIDNFLPEPLATGVLNAFPPARDMSRLRSLREHKHVSASLDNFALVLRETNLAFNEAAVVTAIARVTGLTDLLTDPQLHSSGLARYEPGDYQSPHLDHSLDKSGTKLRRITVQLYLNDPSSTGLGGELEVWEDGWGSTPRRIPAKHNRASILIHSNRSWHAVAPVGQGASRCSLTVAYYSERSAAPADSPITAHPTTFRAWPGHPARDIALRTENSIRRIIHDDVRNRIHPNPAEYVSQ